MEFNTHFGKSLINVVQLKLKTGSIDDVYALLDELVSDVQEQQQAAEDDHDVNNVKWNNDIQGYNDALVALNDDLTTQQSDLADYESQNLTHSQTYADLVETGVELADHLEDLNDWWVQFSDAYNTRQAERQRVLDALDTIISKLTEKYNAGSFIQMKDLVSSLKAVKSQKNPILALVELTLSFNPATVKNIIDRLTSVRDSVSAGASQDSEFFDYSNGVYQVQLASFQSDIATNTDEQNAEVVTLAGLRNSIEDTETAIQSDQDQIANDNVLLAAVTQTQTDYNQKYTDDSSVRYELIYIYIESFDLYL